MLTNEMQSRNNKIKLYLCVAGLLAMFIIETLGRRILNEYIHTLWIAFFSMLLPYEGILYLVSFLIPLCNLLPHFAHVFLALFAILLFKKYLSERHKTVSLAFAFIILFTLWELLAYVIYGAATINKILGYVSVICVFLWILYEKEHGDYRKHLRFYIFGVFMISALALLTTMQSFSGNWILVFLSGGIRLGGTASSEFAETDVTLNANTLAYFSIVAIACYLSMIGTKDDSPKYVKAFTALEFAFIIIIGMMTVSRSWLIILIALVFIFFIGKLRSDKNLNKVIPIFIVLVVVAFAFIGSSFMQAFNTRFENESVETAGGRTELFIQYFSIFFSSLKYIIFGTGVTEYSAVLGTTVSMHNATQQIIVCLGLPIGLIFISALIIPILKAKKHSKIKIQYWLPLLATVAFVQTIQFLNPNILMLSYIMGLYGIKYALNITKDGAK